MNDFFLADDLSGALDAGAAFWRIGRRVRIGLTAAPLAPTAADQILGLTTETRNAPPAEAAEVVRRVVSAAQAQGGRLVYKKIDSTLRGPVAAELQVLQEMLPGFRLLFAPANPKVGRTVRDGVLLVNGVPVAATEFARDPASPLRDSAIPRLLGAAATPRVVIPDTLTDADLAEAVRRMDAGDGPWVGVGSGALAQAIAERLGAVGSPTPLPVTVPRTPLLMIGGSAHPLNREQAVRLARTHGIGLHEVPFGAGAGAVRSAVDSLRGAPGAILMLPTERTAPEVALRHIVDAAEVVVRDGGVRRIFATGGETASALAGRLGLRELAFVAEIEPGLSLSVGEGGSAAVLLAIKPGGFGDAHTWLRAWERLRDA